MDKHQKFGLGFFILCVITLFFILPSQVKGGSGVLLYPRFIILWLSFFSLLLVFKKSEITKKKETKKFSSNSKKVGNWRVIISFIITLIYINLIDIIGFFVASFPFLVILMWNLEVRNWVKLFIYPFITLFFLYILIEKILLFSLPDGILF